MPGVESKFYVVGYVVVWGSLSFPPFSVMIISVFPPLVYSSARIHLPDEWFLWLEGSLGMEIRELLRRVSSIIKIELIISNSDQK